MFNERKVVEDVTLDAFLLAHYAQPGGDFPDGRAWERAVGELLWGNPGFDRHQFAGTTSLFGRDSLSGCSHELDASASGWGGMILVECKAKREGIEKADIAVFHIRFLIITAGILMLLRDRSGGTSWYLPDRLLTTCDGSVYTWVSFFATLSCFLSLCSCESLVILLLINTCQRTNSVNCSVWVKRLASLSKGCGSLYLLGSSALTLPDCAAMT
jgi:hypothetical protein